MATASSVTGTGSGSALKSGQRNADSKWLGVEHLIGTRIVFAGSHVMQAGADVINFAQTLPGVAADYIIFCQATSTNAAWATSIATTGFTIHGTGSDTVQYMVVRVTNATISGGPPSIAV